MKTLNGFEIVDAQARADLAELQESFNNIEIPEVDLSQHALKSELPTKVSQLENDSKFITREEVPNPDLSEYITDAELEARGYLTEHQSLEGYATEEYVDTAISKINECDTYFFDPVNYEWQTGLKPNYAPDHLIEFADRFFNGEYINLYIASELDSGEVRWSPAEFIDSGDGDGILLVRCLSSFDIDKDSTRQVYKLFKASDDSWRVAKHLAINGGIVSKKYVDDAIAALRAELTGGTE